MTHGVMSSANSLAMFVDAGAGTRLMTLHSVDYAIIVIYFLMVLGIGFYLKKYTATPTTTSSEARIRSLL